MQPPRFKVLKHINLPMHLSFSSGSCSDSTQQHLQTFSAGLSFQLHLLTNELLGFSAGKHQTEPSLVPNPHSTAIVACSMNSTLFVLQATIAVHGGGLGTRLPLPTVMCQFDKCFLAHSLTNVFQHKSTNPRVLEQVHKPYMQLCSTTVYDTDILPELVSIHEIKNCIPLSLTSYHYYTPRCNLR